MDPLQIALIALAVAGIWAVAEIALIVRRARTAMGSLDKTVEQLNETIEDARPLISRLDSAMDELEPALGRIDPLLKSVNVATDALSANLIEVEGIVRDVSRVSGAAASAGDAVSTISSSATDAVQRFFDRRDHRKDHVSAPCLDEARREGDGTEAAAAKRREGIAVRAPRHLANRRYYTYDPASDGRNGHPGCPIH